MRKILRQFSVAVTVIFSLCFIFSGASLVSKRSSEISEGESFAVFAVKNTNDKLEFETGESKISIDFSSLKGIEKFKNLIFFTPVGAAVGFVKTLTSVLGS